jgi:preprotein translocase subunit SecD
MLHFAPWKIILVCLACLLGVIGTVPNFFPAATVAAWPGWVPKRQINLGLDLRGGAHFLLAMNIDELRRDWLDNIRGDVRSRLREAKLAFSPPAVQAGSVQVRITDAAQTDEAIKQLQTLSQTIDGAVGLGTAARTNITITKGDAGLITLAPTEPGLRERESNAISAAIETVRRRVDPEGTREANIVRQGRDRILIQVPGIETQEQVAAIKDLLKQTAKLSFRMVHPTIDAAQVGDGRAPTGYRLVPSKENGAFELLQEIAVVGGEDLTDANPGFEQRTSAPIVSFKFNGSGSRKFCNASEENVGRRFAIVLDEKVISAPVIREKICGGSGQISGNFTVESANELAVLLRSGALPASLSIAEERTVGASLGADSIKAAQVASVVGTLLICAFMIFAYGLFGVFALIAVAFNIAIIVALMSLIGSTLTLPGIAGLLLTVGMAVDANVLIYERIREELRNGRTSINAIEAGFERAMGTIIDSNLTTLIAGVVMFWLGSGPIRGFAVTLSIGIVTTVFTAVTLTRLLIWLWLSAKKSKKIPAPL